MKGGVTLSLCRGAVDNTTSSISPGAAPVIRLALSAFLPLDLATVAPTMVNGQPDLHRGKEGAVWMQRDRFRGRRLARWSIPSASGPAACSALEEEPVRIRS